MHDARSTTTRSTTHEYRQVVDINSVHHIKEVPTVSFTEPVIQQNIVRSEKSFHLHQGDRDLNLESRRIEKVIDDDHQRNGVVKISIDHPKYRNTNYHQEIPERKSQTMQTYETVERRDVLIINDVDNRRMNMPLNIDGQMHLFKNELQINSDHQAPKIDFKTTQKNVEELSRRLVEIESQQPVKRPETEIVDKRTNVNKFLDIDEPVVRQEVVKGKLIIDILGEGGKKHVPVETIVDTVIEREREVWEDFPKIETSITEEIIYQPPIEEEEEIFDEWTEVFTITIRNIRYKIIWVGF